MHRFRSFCAHGEHTKCPRAIPLHFPTLRLALRYVYLKKKKSTVINNLYHRSKGGNKIKKENHPDISLEFIAIINSCIYNLGRMIWLRRGRSSRARIIPSGCPRERICIYRFLRHSCVWFFINGYCLETSSVSFDAVRLSVSRLSSLLLLVKEAWLVFAQY